MAQQSLSSKLRISAILNLIAGVLSLGAGVNIIGATPGPHWIYFVLSALFLIAGVWGLIR
jgi:hypothetical protein